MLVIGLSGWFKRAMTLVPMPVVMGMVAGVFLRFGLDLVRTVRGDLAIAGPMVVVFLLLSATRFGRRVPPLIGALLVGALAAVLLSRIDPAALGALEFVRPVGHVPIWSLQALGELVVPLAVTVLVVQNGQGFALLTAIGHAPPVNMCTVVCGIGSLFSATVGAVNTCITGPTNALVTSSGEPSRHYTAAVATGVLAMVFGLLAPTFTGLMLAAPVALITALGGLAMLRVLQVPSCLNAEISRRGRCVREAPSSALTGLHYGEERRWQRSRSSGKPENLEKSASLDMISASLNLASLNLTRHQL